MSINDNPTHIKTRFAPSPTGYLHVGGARTALFNYLFAKSWGTFLLRIEDTDPERSNRVLRANTDFHEMAGLRLGRRAYHQSERMHIYQQYTQKLLEEGKAYRCFVPPRSWSRCESSSVSKDSNTLRWTLLTTYPRRD